MAINPDQLDLKSLTAETLKGLSKDELSRLVLKLSADNAKKDKIIEQDRLWKLDVAAVVRKIADDAELMKLEARSYYLSAKDIIAKDINTDINRIVMAQLTVFHRLSGLFDSMKTGNEKSGVKGRQNSSTQDSTEEKGRTGKKPKGLANPLENMKSLLKAVNITDLNRPVFEVIDEIQKIIDENKPASDEGETKENRTGRKRNIDKLDLEKFIFGVFPSERQCPHCKGIAVEKSVYEKIIKTRHTVMRAKQGIATPIRVHNYLCPSCNRFHTILEGADYPISLTRTMGLKPIVQSFYLHYLGMALNRAGASFENGALLGSDTLNRNAFEWGLIYIMPLYEALLRKMKEQRVLAADETVYNVTQPMGYGRKPEDEKTNEGTCAQTYVLSFGTVYRSIMQLHAYALMEGRGADEIAKILDLSYKFLALVTDAYAVYDKVLQDRPDCEHQICLIHFRRHLMRRCAYGSTATDFMNLTEEQQVKVMEKARKENGIFYEEARIFQAISLIYGWEKKITKARGDPKEIARIRKKQTALMDLIDQLMGSLSEGRIEKTKKGNKWRAVNDSDPLAEACTFYYNNRGKLRCFLKEDNYEIPPDSSVVEQNIRPIALIRNNSHFFTNADYARVALAVFSIFRTLEMNEIDPLKWMDEYCRELFEHITARGLDQLYLDTGDEKKTWITVRQEPKLGEKVESPYCLSTYASSFNFDAKIDEIVKTGIENRSAREST